MSTDNNPQIPKIDETKPVVWTPEDASRFLTSAIHEAQKPLAEALKQRPITSRALTLIVAVLVVAALAIALILSNQLEKTEKRAEAIQAAREEILSEKMQLQAQTSTLQDRLSAVTDQQNDLRGQIDSLRQNEERHKRTQTDLMRFRRQNELLRSQISGLEMEKVALARQLDAVKALAEAEPLDDGEHDPFESSDPASQTGSGAIAAPAAAADAEAPEENSPVTTPAAPHVADSATPAPEASETSSPPVDKYSGTPEAIPTEPATGDASPFVVDESGEQDSPPPATVPDNREESVLPESHDVDTDGESTDSAGIAPESREDFKKDIDQQIQPINETEERFESPFEPQTTEDIAGPTAETAGSDASESSEASPEVESAGPTVDAGVDESGESTAQDVQDGALDAKSETETVQTEAGAVSEETETEAAEDESTISESETSEDAPEAAATEDSNDVGEYVTLDPDATVPTLDTAASETIE